MEEYMLYASTEFNAEIASSAKTLMKNWMSNIFAKTYP